MFVQRANTTVYLNTILDENDLPDICTLSLYDPELQDLSDRMLDLSGYAFTDNYVESRLKEVSDDGGNLYASRLHISVLALPIIRRYWKNMAGHFRSLSRNLGSLRRKQRKPGFSYACLRSSIRDMVSSICAILQIPDF